MGLTSHVPFIRRSAQCGLANAAFCETFAAPASPRGRGGDLNASRWGVSRLAPGGLSFGVNPVRKSTMPTCRAGIVAGDHYPPNDMQICDSTGLHPGALMMGVTTQDYGDTSISPRQPFDFASRTGTVVCDVTAICESILASYVQLSLTEDPTPSVSYHAEDNQEPGANARNGILIELGGAVGGGTHVGVSAVYVYTDAVQALIAASFELTGTNRPTTLANKFNHLEVRVSATNLQVWMSDYSTDDTTFTNLRRIWEGTITAPMTRAYVHFGIRIHSNIKFDFPATTPRYWDNCGFDGPVLAGPRAYEITDNTTTDSGGDPTYSDYPWNFMNLGYEVSDGSGRAEGVWSPTALVSPLTFTGSVNLSGMTTATLTLHLFVQSITHTPDTTWGLKYKFNGGTWRTRLLTAAEVSALIAYPGTAGYLALAIPVTFADLATGTNTIDFSTVNVPMDFAAIVQNMDLLVAA